MTAANVHSSDARCVADRLGGLAIPPVVLSGYEERSLELRKFTGVTPVVIYFYPGRPSSPQDEGTTLGDAEQHRAFRDHQPDLEARGYRAIGISSQSKESQLRSALESPVRHQLLSDPMLRLAHLLGLPTLLAGQAQYYHRLTLVINSGCIEKMFYPVSTAARSAAQVIAWMSIRGIG